MAEAPGKDPEHGSGMSLHELPDRSIITLYGEIDLAVRHTAGPLCAAVAERALPLVIDAEQVQFIDSTGMSVLVRLARDAETHQYPVSLRNAPWMLRELLDVTGVSALLPADDSARDGAAPALSPTTTDDSPTTASPG
ncbi:STAS domain-containing protein [Actinotalea sp. K2]|uniref:STAS domain-containing protein n=1 Tax=Actinotalea sp. K2 TaxID=2939438 RepID=UPI0020178276|nr:STAS domain-containing protein [Actinotalea sp. K2]MCL3860357.1 STAS domain-containing protein [Actinotalea sp. K2]